MTTLNLYFNEAAVSDISYGLALAELLHILFVFLQFLVRRGLLLTRKSEVITLRVLVAVRHLTSFLCFMYSSSSLLFEMTGGVSMIRFPR